MENWKKKATTLETIHRHFSLFISVRHSPSCTIAFLYFYLFPCPHFHSRKDQPNDWEQEWKKGTVESGGHDLKWQTNVPYICVPDTDADGYHLERLRSPPPAMNMMNITHNMYIKEPVLCITHNIKQLFWAMAVVHWTQKWPPLCIQSDNPPTMTIIFTTNLSPLTS